jgi:hypothetical protein
MTSLHEKPTILAALLLASVLIPGAQGCSSPPPDWLEVDSGESRSMPSVRVDSPLSDQEMEQFLLNAGLVTAVPSIIPATTLPMPVDMDWNGQIRKAIFKYGHVEDPDSGHREGEGVERIALDSYRYEVAAYRLDRLLGLEMVPVAVIRRLKRDGEESTRAPHSGWSDNGR